MIINLGVQLSYSQMSWMRLVVSHKDRFWVHVCLVCTLMTCQRGWCLWRTIPAKIHSSFRFRIIGKRFYTRLLFFKLNSFTCSPYIFNSLHQITLAESFCISNSTLKIFNTTSEFSFTLQWSLIKTICRGVRREWLFSPSCFAPFVQTWRQRSHLLLYKKLWSV